MKKRVILMMVVLTFLLAACCDCKQTIRSLNEELVIFSIREKEILTELENLRTELEDTQALLEENLASESMNVENTNEKMHTFLEKKAASNNYADWNEVASCEYATPEILLQVASKTAEITTTYEDSYNWALKIAYNIEANPNTTANVLEELLNSNLIRIWDIIASSDKIDEASLRRIANRVSKLNTDLPNNYNWVVRITEKITENSVFTAAIAEELLESDCPDVRSMAQEALETLNS
ncbi:MAG: hypothetical protein IJW20_00205 [Clostridia bacterium]|nr:hypothetical protein [Clostridia bacterium]